MEIFITDVISNTLVNRVLQEIIAKKNKQEKTIIVYINSPGGEVECGYAIYEILKLTGCKIITYVINECFSSAISIFLAGDERYATPHSTFMIHEPYHEYDNETNLTTKSYKKYLKELQGATNEYFKLISKHTMLTPYKIRKFIEKGDWYFKSDTAKKLGFVTKISPPLF